MDDIKIVEADERLLESCARIIADAFEKEGASSYMFDFSKKNTKKYFYRQTKRLMRSHFESNDRILAAIKGDDLVGVAVLNRNERVSLVKKLRNILRQITSLIPLLTKINFRRALLAREAFAPPRGLSGHYYTLFALAVHPEYQGQGIGKMLLNEVHKVGERSANVSGIYLYTADKKNQQIYEKFGYETIEERKGGDLVIFHMHRRNR